MKSVWTTGWAAVLLVLAVGLVYHNALDGPFVMDDTYNIRDNPAVRVLWPPWVALNPAPVDMTFYTRPFINLTMCVDHALWGLNPRGYHLTSLLFHVLAVLMLGVLVRRTFVSIGRPPSEAGFLGFAVALLWGIHPLNTGAVSYLSQRGELAVGLFLFLMLYCLNRAENMRPGGPRALDGGTVAPPSASFDAETRHSSSGAWLLASVFFCLLGMGSKETMAAAPVLALAYDRVFLAGSWREALRRRGGFYLLLILTWLWPLSKHLVFSPQSHGGTLNPVTWRSYWLTQTWGLNRMIRLMLWPHPLIFDYGRELAVRFADVRAAALGLVLLLGVAAWAWFRHPRIGFVGLSFFALLAPASLFPVIGQPIAEHRMYVPLAPALVLLVLGAEALGRWHGWSRRHAGIALAVLALLLGQKAWRRNAQYQSELMLWTDTLAKWPGNARAWYNRGLVHQGRGDFAAALSDYTRSLELFPGYVNSLVNRAKIYFDLRHYDLALADLDRALAASPDWPDVLARRAMILRVCRRHREAAADLSRALALQPGNPVYLNELAWVLATAPDDQVRDGERARQLAERAARLTQRDYHVLDTLAAAHAAQGQFAEARDIAREAVLQAEQKGDGRAARRIRERLDFYGRGESYRE